MGEDKKEKNFDETRILLDSFKHLCWTKEKPNEDFLSSKQSAYPTVYNFLLFLDIFLE